MNGAIESSTHIAGAGIDTNGDIAPMDWNGQPITAATCATCAHATLHAQNACEVGRSCMQDVYARRIDRFFRTHPTLANGHLAHPHFEVRAIAARHADLFHLRLLMADPDETVRLQVALRLPQRLLVKLLVDPHREVRIRVAQRIDAAHLPALLGDADYQVRCIVARRLPENLLPRLMHDGDLQVRLEVARRLPMPALWRLADDAAPEVRRVAAQRLPVALLRSLADDADWTVRWEAAGRAVGPVLEHLLQDAEPEVRLRAREHEAEVARVAAPQEEPVHG
jgi:hypothetical protein